MPNNIQTMAFDSSFAKQKKDVIILAPDPYGKQGLLTLLQEEDSIGISPLVVNTPLSVTQTCSSQTGAVIYQLHDGTALTGTLRSILLIASRWPHIPQIILSDRLRGVYQWFSMDYPQVQLWDPRMPIPHLRCLLRQIFSEITGDKQQASQNHRIDPEREHHLEILTFRQRNIIQLLAKGYSFKEIATQLHMQPQTVRSHHYQALRRLGISHSADMHSLYQIMDELIALATINAASPEATLAVMDVLLGIGMDNKMAQ